MTPLELAKIERAAAKQERLKIANNIRLLCAKEESLAEKAGRTGHISVLRKFADMIERGDFSE